MKSIIAPVAVLACTATAALSGGVDRSGQPVAVLFEKGNYAELSFGAVNPSVEGTSVPALGSRPSGDMAGDYVSFSAAYKHQFSDRLSAAIIADQPFGANVDYPTGTGYYAQGSTAELNSTAMTGVLKYTTPGNVSVIGGLRYQTLEAKARVPFVTAIPGVTPPYTANGETDGAVGYLIGVAYEKPEIALRVALTYNSRITHSLTTTETSVFPTSVSATEIVTPQSVNLDVQSGIAKDTLLFGSIRWVEWSKFRIAPSTYGVLTGGAALVSYDSNTISYTLGLGRKFSETWAGSVSLGYESQTGGFSSNLGPTDGYWSIGVGGSYTKDKLKISGGIRYVGIGDARTQLPGLAPAAIFTDNTGLAAGIKIGVTF